MATAGGAVRPRIRPRKIIERPRLTRMLDGSKARIRMLIGAAGYGKTTLAEQWATGPDRRVGWVRCRRSSSDIAVISRLIAAAGATIIPDCDRRLEQRLMVTPDPSREADVLAEILAEDLTDWPRDAWIVIDDYHLAMEAPAAERFVEVVVDQSPIQLLIASRNRPSWVSSRHRLYGDVLEVGQELLAMPADEIAEVFEGSDQDRDRLESFASGWPAVIGLASQSEYGRVGVELPATLYDFFADEIYGALKEDVRLALAVFASLPSIDWLTAREILGRSKANRVCRQALDLGLLDSRGPSLELHPLAQSFLHLSRGAEKCTSFGRRKGHRCGVIAAGQAESRSEGA
jgi:ATP/maltotriose-dependent transcriptional regulator MalT